LTPTGERKKNMKEKKKGKEERRKEGRVKGKKERRKKGREGRKTWKGRGRERQDSVQDNNNNKDDIIKIILNTTTTIIIIIIIIKGSQDLDGQTGGCEHRRCKGMGALWMF
jgi:hypothetical protein